MGRKEKIKQEKKEQRHKKWEARQQEARIVRTGKSRPPAQHCEVTQQMLQRAADHLLRPQIPSLARPPSAAQIAEASRNRAAALARAVIARRGRVVQWVSGYRAEEVKDGVVVKQPTPILSRQEHPSLNAAKEAVRELLKKIGGPAVVLDRGGRTPWSTI